MNGSRSSDDRVFQAAGPDVENARGPNVDGRVHQCKINNTLSSEVGISLSIVRALQLALICTLS